VVSHRGKAGGYALARAPDLITFADVIRAIDGPLALTPCTSRTAYQRCDDCRDEATCVLRRTLIKVREATAGILEDTTLAAAGGLRPRLQTPVKSKRTGSSKA
jgi:Rrf2 family protein